MSIDTLYKNAILSAAAYVNWSAPGSVQATLIEKGFTTSQISVLFSNNESVFKHIAYREYDYSGFSATLFFDRETGQYTIAFRGTEPGFQDLSNDLLLALGIQSFADFLGFGQDESIERFMKDAGLIDAEGNLLVPANSINFTGHSLGGHLATMAAYKFPELVDNVYTYNGAGLSAFDALWANAIEGEVLNTGFNPSADVINVYADKGLEVTSNSMSFWRPGNRQKIFIEQGSEMDNHGIDKLVQSLSLYRLLAKISPSLDSQQGMGEIYSILDSASNIAEHSLEFITEALWTLTLQSDESLKQDVELFWQHFNQSGITHQIVSVAGLHPSDLAVFANTDVDTGRGFRYALIELLPFAMTSNLEGTRANISAYDANRVSEQYLYDRASMLTAISARNAKDVDDLSSVDVAWVGKTWFYDVESGSAVCTNGAELDPDDRRVIFGGDASDWVLGAANDDALYGGDANDTLEGKSGWDYLEGGNGNDLLHGNENHDVLAGGAGDDTLSGDSGNDRLIGGDGSDHYIVNIENDPIVSFDDIQDAGLTDTIEINGISLRNETWIALAPQVWRNSSQSLLLALENPGGSGDLVITAKPDNQVQRILIRNFAAGDYGITLPAYSGDQAQTSDDAAINEWFTGDSGDNTILGTSGRNGMDGSSGNDRLFGGAGNDFISGDAKHTATANWSYTAWKTATGAGWNWQGVTDISGQQLPVGHDILDGAAGDDLLRGDRGNDIVFGGEGDDIVSGGSGHDLMYGGSGNDWMRGDDLMIYGVDVSGEHGSDYVFGEAGDDDIETYGGNDILNGGTGIDYLKGGKGDDVYLINRNDSLMQNSKSDIIDDESGYDVIRFGEGVTPSNLLLQNQGQDLLLLWPDNQALMIRNGMSGTIEQFEFSDGLTLDFRRMLFRYLDINLALNYVSTLQAYGGRADDVISIRGNNTEVSAGQGDDVVYGNGDNHTHIYEKGNGIDRIIETGSSHSLRFGEGIRQEDLHLSFAGDGILSIKIGNQGDEVQVHGYDHGALPVDSLEFFDGTLISITDCASAQGVTLLPDPISLPDEQMEEAGGIALQQEKWLAAARNYLLNFHIDNGWQHIGNGWLEQYSIFSDGSTDRRQLYFNEWTMPEADQSREIIDRYDYYGDYNYDFYDYTVTAQTTSMNSGSLSGMTGSISTTEAQYRLQQMAGLLNTPSAWNNDGTLKSSYGSAVTQGELVQLLLQTSQHLNHGAIFSTITSFSQVINHALAHDGTERLAVIKGDSHDQTIYTYGMGAVDAGAGDDIIDARSGGHYGEAAPGQFIFGDYGHDTIYGSYASDRLLGGSGNDLIYGEDGDDVLKGGAGHDILIGGYGNDRLTGGKGSDTYCYQANAYHGSDVILNRMAEAGQGNKDILEISGVTDYRQLWFGREGNDLRVDIVGGSDRIVVNNWFYDDPAQSVDGRDENELDGFRVITPGGQGYEIANDQAASMDSSFGQLLQAMASWEAEHSGETPTVDTLAANIYENRWLTTTDG